MWSTLLQIDHLTVGSLDWYAYGLSSVCHFLVSMLRCWPLRIMWSESWPTLRPPEAMSFARALGASVRCCASAGVSRPPCPPSALALLSVARRGMVVASEAFPPSAAPGTAASAAGRRSRNTKGGRRVCRGAFPGSVRSSLVAPDASVGDAETAEGARDPDAEPMVGIGESAPGTSRKKRVALWLGYVGTSFRGLQIQPEDYERHKAWVPATSVPASGEGEPAPPRESASMSGLSGVKETGTKGESELASDTPSCSVEAVVEEAILRAGLMLPSNFGDLRKLGWSRSSRTDKGVHSVATVLSLKMEVPAGAWDMDADGVSLASRINEHLPQSVRVFGVLPVSKGFCARSACMSRVYHYLVPLTALLPSEASPLQQDAAAWREGGESGSTWQQYKCSEEEWNAVLDFNRALRTFEGRHAFHNYTVRRIYRPEEGRSRSIQRQKGYMPSTGSDRGTGNEEGAGEGESGAVRDGGDGGEELDRRSCVPAQVCSARAAAALSRTHAPGQETHAGERLEPPRAAVERTEPAAAPAQATGAPAEGLALGTGAGSGSAVGEESGAMPGAQGAREVREDSGIREVREDSGASSWTGGTNVHHESGELQSEGSGAEVRTTAEVQGRFGRKAWWVYASPSDAPTSGGRADRIGAAHFRRVHSCRVHVPAVEGGAGEGDARVVDMWCGAPFVRVVIQGESFMLHQIRKMVGTAIGVVRGKIPEVLLLPSLARHCRIVLPLAPPHGLILASAVFTPARGPGPRVKASAQEGEPQGEDMGSCEWPVPVGSAGLERGADLLPLPVAGPKSQAPVLSTAVNTRMAQFYGTQVLPAVAPSLGRPGCLARGSEPIQSEEPWTDWVQNLDFHSWVTQEEVDEITAAMRAWTAHLEALD